MSTYNTNSLYKIEDYLEEARQALRKAEKLADESNYPFSFTYSRFSARYIPSARQIQFTAKMAEDLLKSSKPIDADTRNKIAEVLKGNFVTVQDRKAGYWT